MFFYQYQRRRYTAFAIVLLAVLIYFILEKDNLKPTPQTNEFIGNEDITNEKD